MCSPGGSNVPLPGLGSPIQALLGKDRASEAFAALPALWVGLRPASAPGLQASGQEPPHCGRTHFRILTSCNPSLPLLAGSSPEPLTPAFPVFPASPVWRDLHALAHFCQQREQVLCLGTWEAPGPLVGGLRSWKLLSGVEWGDLEWSWQG